MYPIFRAFWNKTLAKIPFDFQWKPIPIHPEFAQTYPFFTVLVPSSFPPSNPLAYRKYLNKLSNEELITTQYCSIKPKACIKTAREWEAKIKNNKLVVGAIVMIFHSKNLNTSLMKPDDTNGTNPLLQ